MFSYIYPVSTFFFFFNDPPPTEIYTLSLHDALPISVRTAGCDINIFPFVSWRFHLRRDLFARRRIAQSLDRKSTRLNSSHGYISYAVFCLKKKKRWSEEMLDALELATACLPRALESQ